MAERGQDQSLRRSRGHLQRILEQEGKREDAAATYSLVATRLLAESLKLQPGGAGGLSARRFLHGVLVQLQDDLQAAGIDPDAVLPRLLGLTG
jgi:hypothetical protein